MGRFEPSTGRPRSAPSFDCSLEVSRSVVYNLYLTLSADPIGRGPLGEMAALLGGRRRRGADANRIGGFIMMRCRACRSIHVRCSGALPAEARLHPWQLPYRCLDCNERFWVIRRRARMGAAAVGVLALAIAVAIPAPTIWERESRTAAKTVESAQEQVPFNANTQRNVDVFSQNLSDLVAQEQLSLEAKRQGNVNVLPGDLPDVMSRNLPTSVPTPAPASANP